MQMFGDVEIWTAPQSYLNIFYVLSKTQEPATLQNALSMSLERINVCSTGHSDVKSALDAGWDDAEDALIAHSCKSVAADYLLTRDEKQAGFQQLDIPALTPEEFFDLVETTYGISYAEIDL